MRYILALVAGVFLMKYASNSRVIPPSRMATYKKWLYTYMPTMKNKKLRRAYR